MRGVGLRQTNSTADGAGTEAPAVVGEAATVLVRGGAGGVARYCVRALLRDPAVDRVVVADRDGARVREACGMFGERTRPLAVDVRDAAALAAALGEVRLVVNCVGPFYRFGVGILQAAIDAGCDYIDICDDPAPTVELLGLEARARDRGVTAVVGMGITPGVSNLLAVLAARELDRVEVLTTGWDIEAALPETVGAEPSAATLHGVEQLSGRIRTFREGAYVDEEPVRRVQLDCPGLGVRSAYTIGHPEPVTLPRHIAGLRECRNVFVARPGTVTGIRVLRVCVDRGLLSARAAARLAERIEGAGGRTPGLGEVVARARHTGRMNLPPLFALADGSRHGTRASALVTVASAPAGGLGGTTGVPLAVGAGMMLRGDVAGPGVLSPEAAFDPVRLLDRLAPLCDPPCADAAALLVTVCSWERTSLLDKLEAALRMR